MKRKLLWIGAIDLIDKKLREQLNSEFADASVIEISDGLRALAELAHDNSQYFVVIIDVNRAFMPLPRLVRSIRELKPGAEFLVLSGSDINWKNVDLPRFYRPIFLSPPFNPSVIISCIAKLKEIVDAREDYAVLSGTVRGQIAVSRMNTEALLGLLYRNSGVGIISVRRDGFFTSYNLEAQRMTGYSFDELSHIHKWVQTLMEEPDAVRGALSAVDKYWSEGVGRPDIRLKLKHKDGHWMEVFLTVLVLLDDRGQPKQLVGLLSDPREKAGVQELRTLVDSAPLGLYSYQPGKGFTRFSSSALSAFNKAFSLHLRSEEIIGAQVKDLPIPPETAAMWQSYLEGLAAERISKDQKIDPIGLPGQMLFEHSFISTFPVGRSHGVIALISCREDLDAGQYHNFSKDVLAGLTLNTIPYPVLLMKAARGEGRCIRDFLCLGANNAAVKLFRSDRWGNPELNLDMLFTDESARSILFQAAKRVTESGKLVEFHSDIQLSPNDPTISTLYFWLCKIGDGLAIFVKDVSAQKKEERQLKQYQHIFDYMEEAIIVTDLAGNVIDWNPASERMFGYNKEQILGQSAFILTRTHKGEELEQESRGVHRDGDVWKSDYEFLRSDGSRGMAFTIFTMLKDDQGKPYGTVGICHDVTQQRRLEERLTFKTQELQEKNLALNTLLRHAESERIRACEQVATDLSRRLTGKLQHIVNSKNRPEKVENLAESILQDLGWTSETSEPDPKNPILKLTDKELEVARLIRLGKTTEEIAFVLDKSADTVRLQRISIRKKLGLGPKERNLSSFLKNFELA